MACHGYTRGAPMGRTAAHGGGTASYSHCGDGLVTQPCQTMYQTANEEKADLQGLNDRLAGYMNKIRSMRSDTGSIDPAMYRDAMQALEQELNNLKNMYEGELDKLRRALDNCCQEKNKLASQNNALVDELQRRLDDALKGNADANNRAKSAMDKCGFDNNVKDQELRDLNDRLKKANDIIQQLEAKVRQLSQKDDNLPAMMQQLRDANAEQLRRQQSATEDALNKQLAALKCQLDTDAQDKAGLARTKQQLEEMLQQLQGKLAELEGRLTACCTENQALKEALANERANNARQVAGLENKLRELHEQMMNKVKECKSARDAQVSLKAEIGTYHNLLDAEDKRVSSLPQASTTFRPSSAYACNPTYPPARPCPSMTPANVLGATPRTAATPRYGTGNHGNQGEACCGSCATGGACESGRPAPPSYTCAMYERGGNTEPRRVTLDFNPGTNRRPEVKTNSYGFQTTYNNSYQGTRPQTAHERRSWQC